MNKSTVLGTQWSTEVTIWVVKVIWRSRCTRVETKRFGWIFFQCQSQTICVELGLKYRKLFFKMSACDSWNVEINVLVYENEIFSLLAEFYSAVKKGWQERPFDWIISDFPKAMTVTWSVKNIFMKGWLYLGKTSFGQHICLFSQENLKN